MAEEAAIYGEVFQNMKVADLKKELKARGLSTTGNKNELLERLQEAHISLKEFDNFASSPTGDDSLEQQSSSVGEDVLLSTPESEKEKAQEAALLSGPDDAVLEVGFQGNFTSENTSEILNKLKDEMLSPDTKPLKKRVIASVNVTPSTLEKKPILNRTHSVATENSAIETTVQKTVKKSIPVTVETKTDSDGKKPVPSVKQMSEQERLAMRAKRFNISASGTVKLQSSPKSPGVNSKLKSDSISAVNLAPDVAILKKRAERFGQNVSNVMKQIEEKEKVLKRKLRFGTSAALSAVASCDEQERKKWRAQRFGLA